MTQTPSLSEQTTGLTGAEVAAQRAIHGWNELPRPKRVSPLVLFLRQFTGVFILILFIAAGIALALGDAIDTIAILLVVLLNGILGFVQEWRAENAIEALRNMLSPNARALRDGREQHIQARELVPGDLVILDAGDRVPADLRLTSDVQLLVDESVLTGESLPVDKTASDEDPRLFMGTSVVAGRAEGIVQAIGAKTEFGQIARMTGSVRERPTPLQIQLGKLSRQLGLGAVGIALVIVVIGVLTGREPVEMFMTGLSLAVALVPEGLPAVVTITLALGASAMARQKALARRLKAIETLGAASVICTDKTGTLTENKMTAATIWMPGKTYSVTGTGYDPAGHIARDGLRVRAEDDAALAALLETAITCNHARLFHSPDGWTMIGEPTEAALVTLAYKGWAPIPDPQDTVLEIPFSSARKRMSLIARSGDETVMHVKGAPEEILGACSAVISETGPVPLDIPTRRAAEEAFERLAAEGLRVIAIARKPATAAAEDTPDEDGLVLLGLVGLIAPPRPEVRAAIRGARLAGVRVIMITGDSPVTARAIAGQLGLDVGQCVTGPELEQKTDAELTAILADSVLFARTTPEHKFRIVQALQAQQQVVAMTGDGVNDAPALKQADIGVSMGIRGTDVAKDASDIVLLDDNFATIVRAIAEGRRQFDNVRKFVGYLLSSNAGEVVAITANLFLGGPLIFLATQILWMNLITDGVTAIALGLEKSEPGQMQRPPRRMGMPIVGRGGLMVIAAFGLYTGSASLFVFYTFLPQGEAVARTAAFTAMVVFEKMSVFAFRSLDQPCLRIGWFSNPYLLLALVAMLGAQVAAVFWPPLQILLQTAPLGAAHLGWIVALALPLVAVPEFVKYLGLFQPARART
ncbi:MAG: ATPase P [Confluentimicrobium sp.]|uniref:cation-translocating P-type ATPase n=1 Tax=Actibacterium sp. TaxID=1872125 RepID=UPI000C39942A|nr:HAD-IC family P-type ATPase [Actibacterium sp.]MBC58442.1 ATPase P [Actibacterium sp.]